MPCICEEPEMKWEKQLEMMLEQACRYLNVDQLISIQGASNSGWIGLHEWYQSHLLADFSKNYDDKNSRQFYEEEAARLGWKLTKEKYGTSIE